VIRAVVAGAAGRMGSRVLAMLREEKDFAVTGAFERSGTEYVGRDAGGIRIASGIEPALENGADVVIDFTAPSATMQHAPVCAARGVALVVGTTGLSAEQKTELRSLARRIPLLLAPNMSVGVNVLFRLVAEAAKALGATYEIEIVEMHHRMKRDAPSGTAARCRFSRSIVIFRSGRRASAAGAARSLERRRYGRSSSQAASARTVKPPSGIAQSTPVM